MLHLELKVPDVDVVFVNCIEHRTHLDSTRHQGERSCTDNAGLPVGAEVCPELVEVTPVGLEHVFGRSVPAVGEGPVLDERNLLEELQRSPCLVEREVGSDSVGLAPLLCIADKDTDTALVSVAADVRPHVVQTALDIAPQLYHFLGDRPRQDD